MYATYRIQLSTPVAPEKRACCVVYNYNLMQTCAYTYNVLAFAYTMVQAILVCAYIVY